MTFLVDEKRLEELKGHYFEYPDDREKVEALIESYSLALKVVRAAQNAMPQLNCDSPAEITCRACDLKKALEPFSQGKKESK